MYGVSSRYPPGPTPRTREPLRFRQITLASPQRFFRPLVLGRIHHRSDILEFARLISLSMSHNVDMFDGTIRHQQAMLKIKILSILRSAPDGLSHKSCVFRMNPLEDLFDARFHGSVVLEDSIGFFGPVDFSGGNPPAKTARVAQSLRFR